MTTQLSSGAKNFNWLLSKFTDDIEGVEQALAVSSDGLLIGLSSSMERADADRMAAVITGMQSLAEGACVLMDRNRLRRVIVDMDDGYLLISTISDSAVLGVGASYDCDLGYVGYEMTMLIERVGEQLTPELVTELRDSIQT